MVKKIEYDQNIMHYDIRKLNLNKKYLQQGIISADTRPTVGLGSPPLWEGIQSTIPSHPRQSYNIIKKDEKLIYNDVGHADSYSFMSIIIKNKTS